MTRQLFYCLVLLFDKESSFQTILMLFLVFGIIVHFLDFNLEIRLVFLDPDQLIRFLYGYLNS